MITCYSRVPNFANKRQECEKWVLRKFPEQSREGYKVPKNDYLGKVASVKAVFLQTSTKSIKISKKLKKIR